MSVYRGLTVFLLCLTGFGNTAPVTRLGQICFIPYALIGIPLNILLFNTLLDLTVQLFTFILHHCYRCWRVARRRITKQNTGSSSWEPTATSIAFLSMIFVIIITVISAPLFLFLDGWTFFESVYFAVVAFTTVGFGDFVPSGAHSGSGENVTPHYKIGNWIVIIIGMVFTYPAMAVMASVYRQLLNFVFEKSRKYLAKKTNRVLVPHATSSSEHAGGRTGDRGGLSAEERQKITAQRVLKTWKALKKANNMGTINAVEASILKSRLSPTNNRGDQNGIPMAATSRVSIAEGLNTIDELDAVEAKLTREYKQLLNDIKEQREAIKNKPVANDFSGTTGESIGITNEGIGIAIRICSPPVGERKEAFSSQSETTNLSLSPPSTDMTAD